jgi:hypothetical protein
MGSFPDGEHVSGQKLLVEGKPSEQLALRFRMGRPILVCVEPGMATEELSLVGRISSVSPVRGQTP